MCPSEDLYLKRQITGVVENTSQLAIHTTLFGVQIDTLTLETRLNINITCDLTFPLLSIFQLEIHINMYQNICKNIYIIELFIRSEKMEHILINSRMEK